MELKNNNFINIVIILIINKTRKKTVNEYKNETIDKYGTKLMSNNFINIVITSINNKIEKKNKKQNS
jgi:hypothetical protein